MARLLQEKLEEYRKCVPAWLDVTESPMSGSIILWVISASACL